ncbi:MAG: glycoside hydrolase family 172 protein [Fimbriimonadaceae bacterium]
MIGKTTLGSLPYLRNFRSRRSSSFDPAGNNSDWWYIEPGQTATLLETSRPGCVKHIWMTIGCDDLFPRQAVLRMYWDGEEHPSVEVPVGDFFGIGHGVFKDFISLPLQMSPQDGRGMNCWFPMPFDSARITLESECENRINCYFYVDYEEYDEAHGPDVARFHAQWRREAKTEGWLTERLDDKNLWDVWSRKPNTSGDDNYLLLEATGSGVYVGCNLNIDVFEKQGNDWYGEGDDMIFVDGEPWPPALHGTGTEDYFNMAFCPRTEYCAPYHGLTLYSGNSDWPWSGKNSMYRFHIEDPIRFTKSIAVTIEHGHANKLSNDYSSTAYWYQVEPHNKFPQLLPVTERMPRI